MNAPYTALVTGAGRNLGRSIALHLARPGQCLLLHARGSQTALDAVATEARAKGAEVHTLHADLSKEVERERLIGQVQDLTARLDLLVNNAGHYPERDLLDIEAGAFDQLLALNCTAVFHLTRALQPLLRAAAPSRVINLGDSGADRVVAHVRATPYHIAKLGVTVLTRSFAVAFAADGITVNQINPGFLESSVGGPGSSFPAGRAGTFTDILGALDYLLSEQAGYVSGASITVSGAWNL